MKFINVKMIDFVNRSMDYYILVNIIYNLLLVSSFYPDLYSLFSAQYLKCSFQNLCSCHFYFQNSPVGSHLCSFRWSLVPWCLCDPWSFHSLQSLYHSHHVDLFMICIYQENICVRIFAFGVPSSWNILTQYPAGLTFWRSLPRCHLHKDVSDEVLKICLLWDLLTPFS